MDDDVSRFCQATGATRIVALIYLDLYGLLDVAIHAFRSEATPYMVDTVPPHKARSVSQLDLIVSSFRVMAGAGEETEEDVMRYLDQCGWDLKKAVMKFKEDHGLKSKPLQLSHSPKHSHVGNLEDDETLTAPFPSQSMASLGYGEEDGLNEGQGSTTSWVNVELLAKDALDEMILPQIASSSQANTDVIGQGTTMETSTATMKKLKGKAVVDQGTTMDTSPASLEKLKGKSIVDQGTTMDTSPGHIPCFFEMEDVGVGGNYCLLLADSVPEFAQQVIAPQISSEDHVTRYSSYLRQSC